MKIAVAADKAGFDLKETIKTYLTNKGYEVLDLTETPAEDFVDSSVAVAHAVLDGTAQRGIMFDEYGMFSNGKQQGSWHGNGKRYRGKYGAYDDSAQRGKSNRDRCRNRRPSIG